MASIFRTGLALLPALATAVAAAGPDLPPF
ncbi:MAG: hypothetical protein RIS86_333, partial [Planctomycetota bacterium]